MSEFREVPATASVESPPRRRMFFKRTIYSGIFVVLMLAALAYTLGSNYRSNLQAVYVSADNLLENISGRVRAEVGLYFNPARDLASLAANLGGELDFTFSPSSDFEVFLRDGVRSKSQLVMVNVGDVRGNFIMPKMMPDGSTHTKIITWREDGTGWVQWVRRDPSGIVMEIEAYEDSSYDPRTRPWYEGAVALNGEFWTDPYIFFTDRTPGVTVAYPILHDASGELRGVVGVDLDLSKICDFLGLLEVGRTGNAFIHDNEGKLIAYPDMEALIKESGDDLVTAHVLDLGNSVYNRIYNRFQLEGEGERILEIDGDRYFTLSTSLETVVGKDWTLQLVAPETDFTGFVSANLQTGIVAGGVVLLLTAGLAILLSIQGYQSEKKAAYALARQEETKGHVETIDALLRKTNSPGDAPSGVEAITPTIAEGAKVSRVSVFKSQGPDGKTGYLALDNYDVETEGHTQGMILDSPALIAYLEPLVRGEIIEVQAPFQDEALSGFVGSYLRPLGIQHLILCPIFLRKRFLGFLSFENRHQTRRPFSPETRRYLKAVSAWLGYSGKTMFANHGADLVGVEDGNEEAESMVAGPSEAGGIRVARRRRYSRVPFSGLAEPIQKGNFEFSSEAFVLAIHLPGCLSTFGEDGWDPEFIHKAFDRLEEIGSLLGIERVLLQGNILLCALNLTPGADRNPSALGDAALQFIEYTSQSGLPREILGQIQMGIDCGACFSGSLGKLHQHDNIWGEAVDGAMAVMESSPEGMIQCTGEAYQELKNNFLFQDRGRFYFEHLGEVGLYLLTARVSA